MTIQELERCIQLYGRDIYSFCMHLTKEKGSADDLYQDTFLEATKKLAAIRYEDNPKSYLLSVAIRLWKNRVRKLAWRNRIAPQVGETTLEQEGGATPDVSEKAVANEERGMLWKAIDALDDRYRIPLLLYYMDIWRSKASQNWQNFYRFRREQSKADCTKPDNCWKKNWRIIIHERYG